MMGHDDDAVRDDWLGEQDGEALCRICGEWLSAEELDDDLCEAFLGAIICFDCAARYSDCTDVHPLQGGVNEMAETIRP